MKTSTRHFLSVNRSSILFIFLCITLSMFQVESAFAESKQSQPSEDTILNSKQQSEYESSLEAALKVATPGPATVALQDQASINIPEDYLFIPAKEARDLLKSMGTQNAPDIVGVILASGNSWMVTVDFVKSGYVRDDDAKNWSKDKMLTSIKEGTDDNNEERAANGFPLLEVLGWAEEPKYNSTTHQLIWSIIVNFKNTNEEPVVNYNTFVLGREGYFTLDLVTDKSAIIKDKVVAQNLLDSLHFNKGKQYGDFSESTDKVAAYGLAALITGIAAKKLGLLALAGAFLIKGAKFLIVLPALFWGRIKKFFSRNKTAETTINK